MRCHIACLDFPKQNEKDKYGGKEFEAEKEEIKGNTCETNATEYIHKLL
jgi:hypothetical protein